MLPALIDRAERAGIFLDFDGSLSSIVARPSLAEPFEGVREALAELIARFGVVSVVSGRSTSDIEGLVDVPGVRYEGSYGMSDAAPVSSELVAAVATAVSKVGDAWVEDKGASVGVHYRQTKDPVAARALLVEALGPIAAESGSDIYEGKMVIELVPAGASMKGDAVERIVAELSLEAVLFAGDDFPDLDAFAALDRMAARGIVAVKVAVAGSETPDELLSAADLTVDGPAGLVELLRTLAEG